MGASRKGRRTLLTTSRLKKGWEARQQGPGKRSGTPPKNRKTVRVDIKRAMENG